MGGAKIGLIFAHRPPTEATWPRIGYDYDKRSEEVLKVLRAHLPGVEFMVFRASSPEEGRKIVEETRKDVDGYVVYILGIWTAVPKVIAYSGKPTILIDDLFGGSGEFLIAMAEARRANLPVVGVSSSDIRDVVETVKLLKVIHQLKGSKIIVIRDPELKVKSYDPTRSVERGHFSEQYLRTCKEVFGVDILTITPEKLRETYDGISAESAEEYAKKWTSSALRVVEVSEEEVLKSAKLYLALKRLADEHKALAVSVDCLTLFYVGKLPAYPCLSHMQMLDEGRVGTCEADMDSAISQLVAYYLTGRPAFISDPVIDESTGTIVYAHCVAPTRVWGPQGGVIPYIIKTHAEDGKGASVQAIYPVGETVTTFKINVKERAIAIHTGKIVGNLEEDEKGCRTKVVVKTNVEAILNNWNRVVNFDWHRVTVIGDYRKSLKRLAVLLGLKVIEEDRDED